MKWYRKAAEQNDVYAQFALAVNYATGQGVAKDEAEAIRWYRQAAARGFAPAQFNLGVCYTKGQGVTKDYTKAYKWFDLASLQGVPQAKDYFNSIVNSMTPQQIYDGWRQVQAFKPVKANESSQPDSQ